MSSVRKPRGRPFKAGNAGRPLGSKNKVTQIVEQLAEGEAEALIQKALELAKAGEASCLRMLLDRLWPARKGQPVNIDIPSPVKTPQDVLAAIGAVWTAVADGRLTPDEASALSLVVERSIQAIELQDVLKRLATLEQKVGGANEKEHF